LAILGLLTIVVVTLAMVLFDPWQGPLRHFISPVLREAGEAISHYGRADWILFPCAAVLLAVAAVASPALGRKAYAVLLLLAARCGFVLLSVALPGLTVAIVKRLIGRARPGQFAGTDLHFVPFSWSAKLASFPSGHTTTAFAAAVALGALFPRARIPLFAYAAAMAAGRVFVSAHYPSDVIAGAIVGTCGALLVRAWFAHRKLGFFVAANGRVKRMAAPSPQRIVAAMRRAFAA
jgi:undecaprenyl-diphosphatase